MNFIYKFIGVTFRNVPDFPNFENLAGARFNSSSVAGAVFGRKLLYSHCQVWMIVQLLTNFKL